MTPNDLIQKQYDQAARISLMNSQDQLKQSMTTHPPTPQKQEDIEAVFHYSKAGTITKMCENLADDMPINMTAGQFREELSLSISQARTEERKKIFWKIWSVSSTDITEEDQTLTMKMESLSEILQVELDFEIIKSALSPKEEKNL